MVQYRNKKGNHNECLNQAKKLLEICREYGALFIVNDYVDIALAIEADGVHLGQDDLPVYVARSLIGSDRLIGKSTHSIDQILSAEQEGCDYFGVGPVYESETKKGLESLGINYVNQVSMTTKYPWFAIGGINLSNILQVKDAGANRVAISSGIFNSDNPSATIFRLLKDLK